MTVPFGVPAPLPPGDPTSNGNGPRLGARVLLLDANDRLLLLHAHDPTERDRRWWELPGGGLRPSETTAQLPETDARARQRTCHTANERLTLLGERWWSAEELAVATGEWFLPPNLPELLPGILAGRFGDTPIELDR